MGTGSLIPYFRISSINQMMGKETLFNLKVASLTTVS